MTQQLGSVLLDDDLRFKIEPGGKTKIFVVRTGVAIDAAVLAATVGIDARFEADVRAGVAGDDGDAGIPIKLRLRRGIVRLVPLLIAFIRGMLEAIGRILRRPAATNGFTRAHHDDNSTYGLAVKIRRPEPRWNLLHPRARAPRQSWADSKSRSR